MAARFLSGDGGRASDRLVLVVCSCAGNEGELRAIDGRRAARMGVSQAFRGVCAMASGIRTRPGRGVAGLLAYATTKTEMKNECVAGAIRIQR